MGTHRSSMPSSTIVDHQGHHFPKNGTVENTSSIGRVVGCRVVTRTYITVRDKAFAAAGPGLWNSLLSHLKETDLSYNPAGGR